MAITHQEIADRFEALGKEQGAAYRIERARIQKERDSLSELCGGLGHIFGRPPFAMDVSLRCLVCGASKQG